MRKSYLLVMLFALLLVSPNAWAQGFSVYEHSACAMARGGASVAAPCDDGSGVFFNPASLALGPSVISLGSTVINPRGSFTSDASVVGDLNVNYYPVPNFYVSQRVGKWAIGGGLFAPYGLTTDWPLSFEGRFLGYHTQIKGIYIQPTVAYQVTENFAIGGGLDITYASLDLNQHVDLSSQYVIAPGTPGYPNGLTFASLAVPKGTDFANVELAGNTWQTGFHLGMEAKVSPNVSIGARYMSRQNVNVSYGNFTTQQIKTGLTLPIALGPTLPAGTPIDLMVAGQFGTNGSLESGQGSSATGVVFPDQFVVGTAFKVAKNTTILLDYQFTHWSLFQQIVINRANAATTPTVLAENFNNTHAGRFGIEHEMKTLILRGGFLAHTAAAPDATVTPLLPEGARREITGGIGAKVSPHFRLDFAYQYLMQSDRRGRTVSGDATANNGVYSFMSHLFSAELVVLF